MLLGPLGLQSQLIGYLERLAKRQYNLIGQVLYGKGERGRPGPRFKYSGLRGSQPRKQHYTHFAVRQ